MVEGGEVDWIEQPDVNAPRAEAATWFDGFMYSPFVRYNRGVPNSRVCVVSFRDMRGVTHSVEVAASSLFEAAALALGAFRSSDFAGRVDPRTADCLTVAVKVEEARHEVRVGDLEAWLACAGKSPREQALKIRLRQTLTEAVWEERR